MISVWQKPKKYDTSTVYSMMQEVLNDGGPLTRDAFIDSTGVKKQ